MLTKITIRNFKMFEEAKIPLDNGVVFIGPNNSGKTSALQALSLWHVGLQKWAEKHGPKNKEIIPPKRPGVPVNRLDLIPLPVTEMDLIWRDRKVRVAANENVRLELIVEGISKGREWQCGLEFDYSNAEAFFCRPLRLDPKGDGRMEVPPEALETNLAFLPSMSGLALEETLLQEGRINVLIGQGQTAEVLRNICYRVHENHSKNWLVLVEQIKKLFGVTLNEPRFISSRGTVSVDYCGQDGKTVFDLSSSGRGMQQVLLLLAYLYDNPPETVLLLDEPDAHLEVLRQRQIYDLLIEVAKDRDSQIIAASHSEVLLNRAGDGNPVVAFIGKPHTFDKPAEVLKSLRDIGFEYYCMAESQGWMLYLEGESDLQILRAFASRLDHPAHELLLSPPVRFLETNLPQNARSHFYGLREAKDDLVGVMLLDRVDKNLDSGTPIKEMMWKKREIENYICSRKALLAFVESSVPFDLFAQTDREERIEKMEQEIEKMIGASEVIGRPGPFSDDIKASEDFLDPLFRNYSKALEVSCVLKHPDYYDLVKFIPEEEIDDEIREKLDAIVEVAAKAKPRA